MTIFVPATGHLATLWRSPLGVEMRTALARLELVSAGTTQSYNSGGGEGENPLPSTGDASQEHLAFRRRFEDAEAEREREAVLRHAQERLEQLTGRGSHHDRPVGETLDQLEQRIRDEGRGYSLAEAAVHFRCLERVIVRARQSGDLRVDTGDPLPGSSKLSVAEELAEVRRMAAGGMTERQIQQCLGISKSTVRRRLGRAA